jgi:hypothetical protein
MACAPLAVLLAAALAAAPAPPPSADEVLRDQVETLLETIDTPIGADRWRALGPGAAPVLAGTAQAAAALPSTRSRAIAALGVVDSAEAARVGQALAADPEGHPVVRATALRVLGSVLAPARLRAVAEPVMAGARPLMVRAAAAEVLARGGGSGACDAVRARIAREGEVEREAFHRAADLCR